MISSTFTNKHDRNHVIQFFNKQKSLISYVALSELEYSLSWSKSHPDSIGVWKIIKPRNNHLTDNKYQYVI